MKSLDIPQPATVRTVRSRLNMAFSCLEKTFNNIREYAEDPESIGPDAENIQWAMEAIEEADRWLDHCTDRETVFRVDL